MQRVGHDRFATDALFCLLDQAGSDVTCRDARAALNKPLREKTESAADIEHVPAVDSRGPEELVDEHVEAASRVVRGQRVGEAIAKPFVRQLLVVWTAAHERSPLPSAATGGRCLST